MPDLPHSHDTGIPRTGRPAKHRFYKTVAWRGIRARYLARNPQCVGCGRAATEVDHVNGDNSDNAVSNLQAFCKSCHSRKTRATT